MTTRSRHCTSHQTGTPIAITAAIPRTHSGALGERVRACGIRLYRHEASTSGYGAGVTARGERFHYDGPAYVDRYRAGGRCAAGERQLRLGRE